MTLVRSTGYIPWLQNSSILRVEYINPQRGEDLEKILYYKTLGRGFVEKNKIYKVVRYPLLFIIQVPI